MIKQTLTYDDFDGNKVTRDFYFHLSKADLLDMTVGGDESFETKLISIAQGNDWRVMMNTFKQVVAASVGVRNGEAFEKSEEITRNFMGSPAFDAFLEAVVNDVDAAARFINGVVPKDLATPIDQIKAQVESEINPLPVELRPGPPIRSGEAAYLGKSWDEMSGLQNPRDENGKWLAWAFRKPTQPELRMMSGEELKDASLRMNSGWEPPATDPTK
jgi:hypothetical protein